MGLITTINAMLAPLARRVRLTARRAVVKLVYDDPKMQELQLAIMAGEIRDQVERWEDYGLTSHPHPGAEALVLALGGNTAHSVVVKVGDRRYRLTSLAAGEVALYDDQGQAIHLKRDKVIHIYGCDKLQANIAVETVITCPLVRAVASTKVVLDAPLTECTGDLDVLGTVTVGGEAEVVGNVTSVANITAGGAVADTGGLKTMGGMRQVFDGHDHPENDNGGPTGGPNQTMG